MVGIACEQNGLDAQVVLFSKHARISTSLRLMKSSAFTGQTFALLKWK